MSLSPADRTRLALKYPTVIGKLDGAPLDMRAAANRINIIAYRDELEKAVSDTSQGNVGGGSTEPKLGTTNDGLNVPRLYSAKLRLAAINHMLHDTFPDGSPVHSVLDFEQTPLNEQFKIVLADGYEPGLVEASAAAAMLTKITESGSTAADGSFRLSETFQIRLEQLTRSADPNVSAGATNLLDGLKKGDTAEVLTKLPGVSNFLLVASAVFEANAKHNEGLSWSRASYEAAVSTGGFFIGAITTTAACEVTTGPEDPLCPIAGLVGQDQNDVPVTPIDFYSNTNYDPATAFYYPPDVQPATPPSTGPQLMPEPKPPAPPDMRTPDPAPIGALPPNWEPPGYVPPPTSNPNPAPTQAPPGPAPTPPPMPTPTPAPTH